VMPKEVIHDDTVYSDGNSSPLALEVLWGRNSYVQVASINLPLKETNPHDPVSGFYVDLDRPMINKAIRVLRRARDQAYGADE
jgi:hypothetical protein